jgi:hypothetical protein
MNVNQILGKIEQLSMERDTLVAERQKQILEREVNRLKSEVGGTSNFKEQVGEYNYSKMGDFFGWQDRGNGN